MTLAYASVCDGIGAAHVAWAPLGWRCAWTSEIDPFPAAVVDHHWNLPNLGDMTTITEDQTDAHGAIDLLVGGTPCQSFSVAGLRRGLADPRGNLALVYLGLADRLRPRWLAWENVPGVLSSGGGRDFGAFLGGLAELGYGFAYRVLDAQYVRVESHARAVPQRRRRVFVVGYLGDWRRAASVLLERQSLCRYPPPRREAGEGAAADAGDCAAEGRFLGVALGGNQGGGGNRSGILDDEALPSITTQSAGRDAVAFDWQSGGDSRGLDPKDTAQLQRHQTPAIAVSGTLQASDGGMVVRRLTPTECERLQGFTDGYTAITYRGKPAADGPRYKALGNSMAVNVMRWIGERIAIEEAAQ